ncbi:MAG: XRE family transcriptional regulator [Phocaeicola plebeius]|nr:XRE family transcriptional regulator [Phocaeicola plebeius]
MDEQIILIAQRLQGLRDALELGVEEMAARCGLSADDYRDMESGASDLSVARLQKVASANGISLDELMFGEEPKMTSYFLTRRGTGISVERTKAYKYQSLASGFKGRKADPFIVTVEPKPDDVPVCLNTHHGQEFDLVIEGRLLLKIGDKELLLNLGDSVYYDANQPHGMKALDGRSVKFLAVVIN